MSGPHFRYHDSSAAPSPENGFPKRPPKPMLPSESHPSDRREFLRGAVRYAALGGIAALVAAGARRGSLAAPNCPRARFCDACARFAGCDKDQARATRDAANAKRGAS